MLNIRNAGRSHAWPIAMLALSGFAGGAHAQSSVTIFGVVDATWQMGSGSIADRTQLGNGGTTTPRIGFRGVEDLGGGLRASFHLEAGASTDSGVGGATNTNNQASGAAPAQAGGQGLTFARRSTVALAGNWGEVRLGRDYVAHYWGLLYDPFGNVGVGASQTFTSGLGGITGVRASNSFGYFLPPNLGGFFGQVSHYRGENASNAANEDDGNGAGVRLGYANGPFEISFGTGRTKYAAGDITMTNAGGTYNFKVAKLFGHISRQKAGAIDAKGFLIGASIPVRGRDQVRLAFSRQETDATGNPATRKFAIGYLHALSVRSALYTTFATVRNSGGASAALNGAITAPNGSSRGLDVGLRHSF